MKKILAIGLMLCIFTAMAVGTAAAGPAKAKVFNTQYQCVEACGPGAQVCATELAGAAVLKTNNPCKKTTLAIAGALQTASASSCWGTASITQGQTTCAEVCV